MKKKLLMLAMSFALALPFTSNVIAAEISISPAVIMESISVSIDSSEASAEVWKTVAVPYTYKAMGEGYWTKDTDPNGTQHDVYLSYVGINGNGFHYYVGGYYYTAW